MGDETSPPIRLTERELSCIRWAVPMIRGIEESYPDLAGVREGEAMSDVLAGIVSRVKHLTGDET